MSKMPKFSNETPVAKKIDHFCDVKPLFHAKWSNFLATVVSLLNLGKSGSDVFCLIVQEYCV